MFSLAPSFFFPRLPGVQLGEVPFFFPRGGPLGGLGLFPLSLPRSFLVPIGVGTDPRAAVVLPLGVSLAERSLMLRFNPDVRSPNGGACGNSTLGRTFLSRTGVLRTGRLNVEIRNSGREKTLQRKNITQKDTFVFTS